MPSFNYSGINAGMIYIHPIDENGDIEIERNYTIVHNNPKIEIGEQVMQRRFAWADLPQEVKDFLVKLDQWTKQEIKSNIGL